MLSAEALRWYPDARAAARKLSDDAKLPLATVVGIIAATSPRMRWSRNIIAAQRVIYKMPMRDLLPRSRAHAERIRDGEDPWKVLRGPKTRAFYRALMGDDTAIVLDTWMLRYMGWKDDKPTPLQYRKLARRFSAEAKRSGHPTATYQASVWLAQRKQRT